jgi:uncharacterized protein
MVVSSQRQARVLTQAECNEGGLVPEWGPEGYGVVCRALESREPGFPCIYGVRAHNEGGLRYVFIDDDTDPEWLEALGRALWEYVRTCREIGQFTSLLVLFPPSSEESATLEAYRERYWKVLQWLHDHDPAPWPDEVPADPTDPDWEFCFGGLPMFVPANLPIYERRRSRRNPCFMILFQPRFVFDELIAQPQKLAAARQVIRARALEFDDVPVHPTIGVYGERDNLEWRQYVVPDSSDPVQGECPLRMWHERATLDDELG